MYPEYFSYNYDNYKYLLKYFGKYSNIIAKWIDLFTYESSSTDLELFSLREQYKLDNIIMNDNSDIKICLKLMQWTFNKLLYNKNIEYNGIISAKNILNHVKENKGTVNCLLHATVFTEILLSCGFKARKVSCLPLDLLPFDNHVVVNVFIPSLNKWIMLDPSMSCYITNNTNEILSVQEIRQSLINDDILNVCTFSRFSNVKIPSSNSVLFSNQEYINYLYKNFFRFLCRSRQSSHPTEDNEIFYMLVPNNYLPLNLEYRDIVEDKKVIIRVTNNDEYFWI